MIYQLLMLYKKYKTREKNSDEIKVPNN